MTVLVPNRLFRFGVFEADPQTGELRKQGRKLALQEQPFDILVMLLENAGQIVSRTEISERLWPDGTFVDFDRGLNTAVNKLRDALGDSAASPRFIETLARRGYRFIAPVEVIDAKGDSPSAIARTVSAEIFPDSARGETAPQSDSVFAESLLTSADDVPRASRPLVRTLFLLLQVMYLVFYLISLARLHMVEEIVSSASSHPKWLITVLIVTAVVGIPTRLYLISAAGFEAPGLREKFLRLFPLIFPLDELWALAPFLLLQQIGIGLALGCTAILLYVPFAERSLILMGAGVPTASRAAS